MKCILPVLALLVGALAVREAAADPPPVPADVQARVNEYLTTSNTSRVKELETALKDVPVAVVEAAVRAAPPAGTGAPPTQGEVELEVALPDKTPAKVCVFLPPRYDPARSWPALVSMHGTGGHAADERTRWRAQISPVEREFVIVCPDEQPKLRDKGWGSTEPERALTLAAIDGALRRYSIDPDRVFLTGVSRGGHATWELGLLCGDRFAGLYANAGGPRLVNFGYLDNLGGVPLLESLGAQDEALLVENVRAAVQRFTAAGCKVVYHEHAGVGHGVGYGDDPEFAGWVVGDTRRDNWPKKVAHAFARANQGRAWWLEATQLGAGVVDPAARPPAIELPSGQKLSDAEVRELFQKEAAARLARFDAEVKGNRIDIRTQKVVEMTVYLSDRLVDLDAPVEVWIDGKRRHMAKVARDPVRLLQHVRATGDRGRLVANWVRLAVR